MNHNHPMHPEEVKRWEATSRVKELIASNPDAMTGELVKKIKEEFGMDAEEARAALGKHGTFKRFMQRARNKDIQRALCTKEGYPTASELTVVSSNGGSGFMKES